MLTQLKDKHKGETCWIVGKGRSLFNLKRKDIGEGPVIAIYEAIVPVEILGFPNELYCLEKDGGLNKREPYTLSAECDDRKCDQCKGVVRPRRATLIMHELEAKYCFEDYSPRYLFDLPEIGMPENQFSLACAIKIAKFFGCPKIVFVSCDAHATGDTRSCLPVFNQDYYDWIYEMQRRILPPYLEGVEVSWVTPA